MRKFAVQFFAVLLLLVIAGIAEAFYVGEIVWVVDPPRFVGFARIEAIYPNGNCVVNPGYNLPPNMRPWLVEPPYKLREMGRVSISVPPPPRGGKR